MAGAILARVSGARGGSHSNYRFFRKPVYLWIENGNVEIRDASDIWNLETGPALEKLKEKHGRVSAILIGPAGENLVSMHVS